MGQMTEAGLRGIVVDQIERAKNLAKRGKYDDAWGVLNQVTAKLRVLLDMTEGK